ncbi:hypothetical protein ACG9X6_23330 [Acinetobacter guillouiae]|uniref:Uncharacterized protein n=1 Tax=Acinetobacter guillouiae NIPH 991 TaxID=1217656 RepID=N8YGL9_ACIGI|nr:MULTISPECIES: hypothetical protein [Acinetobacter]ENV18410.1 hypothetical protein F964_01735 [Acinetobacter guillouiae NIPH 991]UOH19374.1 hypothetical protein MTO68_04125 [Acinetobacter sp. NyZ410]
MNFIEKIISENFSDFDKLDASENFITYKSNFKINEPLIDEELFKNALIKIHKILYKEFYKKFNYAKLICKIGLNNPISISLNDSVLSALNITEIKDSFFSFDNSTDDIEFEFDISKEKAKTNYILSLDCFFDYINSLNYEEALIKWSFISYNDNPVSFLFWEECNNFHSKTINFYHIKESFLSNKECFDREKYISKRDKISYFKNNKEINLLPLDFAFNEKIPSQYKDYFEKLELILLSAYLADSSEIDGDFLSYRLKGYKLISEKVNIDEISTKSLDELYSIFIWTYNDGNFIDKIGLARNIITIHSNDNSIFSVEAGTLNSLSSGYDIYLKDNVKQYIEIKNKLSEFIVAQSDKSIEITKNMYAGLKLTLWTLITFFMVNFISKIFKLDNSTLFFSDQAFAISIVFIVISFIYLLISWFEVNSDINNMEERFNLIEQRYKDLLNEKDLEKALKKDAVFNQQSKWIKEKRRMYTFFWCFINLIFFITAWAFWYHF